MQTGMRVRLPGAGRRRAAHHSGEQGFQCAESQVQRQQQQQQQRQLQQLQVYSGSSVGIGCNPPPWCVPGWRGSHGAIRLHLAQLKAAPARPVVLRAHAHDQVAPCNRY